MVDPVDTAEGERQTSRLSKDVVSESIDGQAVTGRNSNMAEFELLVIDPVDALPVTELLTQPRPEPERGPSKTPQEALDALMRTEGAESAIERLPALVQPEVWGEIAYFNVCETRGTAVGGTFVWDADFPGNLLSLFDAQANCYVYFAGAEYLGELIPPSAPTGQVWCHFTVPESGYYLFLPHAQTYLEDYYGPDYYAAVECLIDGYSFGEFQMRPYHQLNQPMIANLTVTTDPNVPHRFTIRQITGGVFFWSLTVWKIPVLAPDV